MFTKPGRYFQRVAAMLLHPIFKRLDSLKKQKRIERSQARPEIPQPLDARFYDEGEIAKNLRELHPMVTRARLGDRRELFVPYKFPAIYDYAADGSAMAAQALGGGVHHNI